MSSSGVGGKEVEGQEARPPLPPSILKLSLLDASEALRNGSLTSLALTKACLEHIQSTQQYFNSFIIVLEEEAMKEALASDKRRKMGKTLGPLDGIPLAVKDNLCLQGSMTTAASKILEGFQSPYDATVVERLRKAGAVLVGKTNLDEFGMGSFTTQSAAGKTINPLSYKEYCATYTGQEKLSAGGSSGGSAAAVASYSCFGALVELQFLDYLLPNSFFFFFISSFLSSFVLP